MLFVFLHLTVQSPMGIPTPMSGILSRRTHSGFLKDLELKFTVVALSG